MELAAFQAALSWACQGKHGDAFVYHLGAKAGSGFGRVGMTFRGSMRLPVAPTMASTDALAPHTSLSTEYDTHLKGNAKAILAALEETA
jgi:hypothetical protein